MKGGGILDAPSDGKAYVRKDEEWVEGIEVDTTLSQSGKAADSAIAGNKIKSVELEQDVLNGEPQRVSIEVSKASTLYLPVFIKKGFMYHATSTISATWYLYDSVSKIRLQTIDTKGSSSVVFVANVDADAIGGYINGAGTQEIQVDIIGGIANIFLRSGYLVTKENLFVGGYYNNQFYDISHVTTDYLECINDVIITNDIIKKRFSFYDDQCQFISASGLYTAYTSYNVPSGAKYVRITYEGTMETFDTAVVYGVTPTTKYHADVNSWNRMLTNDMMLDISRLEQGWNILQITDTHSVSNCYMYKTYMNAHPLCRDIIHTGDIVDLNLNSNDGGVQTKWLPNMITMIGNHDATKTGDVGQALDATAKECYDKFIAPYIANWGVVQPSNASDGKCYFYKDYEDVNIRLICLDSPHCNGNTNDELQVEWLSNVLSNAISEGYKVIVAQHYPLAGLVASNSTWNPSSAINFPYGIFTPNKAILDAIDEFIDAGGVFITHICGHYHNDVSGFSQDYPRQFVVSARCAKVYNVWGTDNAYTKTCATLYAIRGNYLIVKRIGRNFDSTDKKANSLVYDYVRRVITFSD